MTHHESYFFTKDHEWISAKSGTAKVGITHFALEQLGDIVHVELPRVSTEFKEHDSFGTVESTKTVSDLFMPAHSKILRVNQEVANHPESIQDDVYGKGWLAEIEILTTPKELLSYAEYHAYLKSEH